MIEILFITLNFVAYWLLYSVVFRQERRIQELEAGYELYRITTKDTLKKLQNHTDEIRALRLTINNSAESVNLNFHKMSIAVDNHAKSINCITHRIVELEAESFATGDMN